MNSMIRRSSLDIADDALRRIVKVTEGCPCFLQEWGKHTWNATARSPITSADVESASASAMDALDSSFFRVRFDRLTPREQDYLRAMPGWTAPTIATRRKKRK